MKMYVCMPMELDEVNTLKEYAKFSHILYIFAPLIKPMKNIQKITIKIFQ